MTTMGRPKKPADEKYLRVTVSLPADVGRWLKSQDKPSSVAAEAIKAIKEQRKGNDTINKN